MPEPEQLPRLSPRGTRRILYNSDPSNITVLTPHYPGVTRYPLTSFPARPGELRRYVDVAATGRPDAFLQEVYSQGWALYFRSDRVEYDQRPQHQRFVPMMDDGIVPLEVLIERAHAHGMEFFAGFRVNDRHEAPHQGAKFVTQNPRWLIEDMLPGRSWIPGNAQDFTFPEVREYLLGVVSEVVERFDIQGIQLVFRDEIYFPHPRSIARQRQHLMTDLVRRVRDVVDTRRGGRLLFGVLVPETLEECHDLGLDVPRWIEEGLLDWVSPADLMYSDFNGRFEEFAALTRDSGCLLYPVAYPYCASEDRGSPPLTLDNYRALAMNYYGAGADGISVYNYHMHWDQMRSQAQVHWAARNRHGPVTGHVLAFQYLRHLREPDQLRAGARHYLSHRLWAGGGAWCEAGARPEADSDAMGPIGRKRPYHDNRTSHLTLRRAEPGERGEYRVRLCEEPASVGMATLYFCATGLEPADGVELDFNGAPVATERVHGVWVPDGRPRHLGRELPPHSQCWFDLDGLPLRFGDNVLGIRLAPGTTGEDDVVLEDVEVVVLP